MSHRQNDQDDYLDWLERADQIAQNEGYASYFAAPGYVQLAIDVALTVQDNIVGALRSDKP